jgi:hypothetical protein
MPDIFRSSEEAEHPPIISFNPPNPQYLAPTTCTTHTPRNWIEKTHLLKLKGWPPGPLRTVMPEVPVEPVALGAGLAAAWGSVLYSVVVLMAAQSPCVA